MNFHSNFRQFSSWWPNLVISGPFLNINFEFHRIQNGGGRLITEMKESSSDRFLPKNRSGVHDVDVFPSFPSCFKKEKLINNNSSITKRDGRWKSPLPNWIRIFTSAPYRKLHTTTTTATTVTPPINWNWIELIPLNLVCGCAYSRLINPLICIKLLIRSIIPSGEIPDMQMRSPIEFPSWLNPIHWIFLLHLEFRDEWWRHHNMQMRSQMLSPYWPTAPLSRRPSHLIGRKWNFQVSHLFL